MFVMLLLKKIQENVEIQNINKILGLVHGSEDINKLRYGKIMVMTDADVDGFHIKGLIMNYIGYFWPGLIEKNFVCSLLTPIIKTFKGQEVNSFYNLEDYEIWKNQTPNEKTYRIKYYKGLGTSTREESRDYFKNLEKNTITYGTPANSDSDSDSSTSGKNLSKLDLVFSSSKIKINTDRRKKWINHNLEIIEKASKNNKSLIDYNEKEINIEDFIDKEFVQFSIYDNKRSIPNIMDGLKPSQRKILYSCFKKKLYTKEKEIKVAQLSGYVSEHTAYHHGETSLNGAITGMAQNFIGSGNINLLMPEGQFGTRLDNGKDASSPRYIFTYINPEIQNIFKDIDSQLLDYNFEDGMKIEPKYYLPSIPMILVNGTSGIGTGWATDVPCFNPVDIKNILKTIINNPSCDEIPELIPWYKNFKGTISKNKNGWSTIGIFRKSTNKIIITEIPIGMSVNKFKENLEKLEDNGDIKNYTSNITDTDIEFIINLQHNDWNEEKIIKIFKLESFLSKTHMYLFDENGIIKNFESPEHILWHFYYARKDYYIQRYELIKQSLNKKIKFLSEKYRFMEMVMNEQIIIWRRPVNDIIQDLKSNNFKKYDNTWSYLIDIKLTSFTQEKLNEYTKQINILKEELDTHLSISSNDLWLNDLN